MKLVCNIAHPLFRGYIDNRSCLLPSAHLFITVTRDLHVSRLINHLPRHSGNFFACTILFYIYYCRIAGNSAGLRLEQLLGTAWFWGDKILISLMAMAITVPFDSKCVCCYVMLASPVPTRLILC